MIRQNTRLEENSSYLFLKVIFILINVNETQTNKPAKQPTNISKTKIDDDGLFHVEGYIYFCTLGGIHELSKTFITNP